MAKIFNPPSSIAQPKLDFKDMAKYRQDCKQYEADLKAFLVSKNPNAKNVGEVIRFPVADGYAEYMVASMKPVQLVHIPLGDAWDFQYVHLLKAKDVQEKIDQQKAMEALFSKKK